MQIHEITAKDHVYTLTNPYRDDVYYREKYKYVPLKHSAYHAPVRTEPKIQRNSPCPCGSGKKYKKCCI